MNKSLLLSILLFLVTGLSLLVLRYYYYTPNYKSKYLEQEIRYKDSISSLQKEIDLSRIRQSALQHSYDSMLLIEPTIIYRTNEKIKFIYFDASADELDSIIRSNWKINK